MRFGGPSLGEVLRSHALLGVWLALVALGVAGALYRPCVWTAPTAALITVSAAFIVAREWTKAGTRQEIENLKVECFEVGRNEDRIREMLKRESERADKLGLENSGLKETNNRLTTRIALLEEELESMGTENLVAAVREYQEDLERARESFIEFLDGVTPLAERFGQFIAVGEAGHDRILAIVRSLDRAIEPERTEDGVLVIKAPVPEDPNEIFSASGSPLSDSELRSALHSIIDAVHPDKAKKLDLPWLLAIFESLTKVVNASYTRLKSARRKPA